MEATLTPTLNKNGNIDLTKEERIQSAIMIATLIFIVTCFISIGYLDNTTPNAFLHAFVFGVVSYLWTYAVVSEQTVFEWEFKHPLAFTKHEQIIYDALLLSKDYSATGNYKYKKSHKERSDYEKSLYMSGKFTQATTTTSAEPVLVTIVSKNNSGLNWLFICGSFAFVFLIAM